ncbi:MAG: hypothetical protein HQL69_04865 [Magnetococcales bacterium]|nr:hypothetical protein [Magnetococcales bacterium]
MNPQAVIEVESGDSLVGKVEKLSSTSLFISFDKIFNSSNLVNGKQYFVSIFDANKRSRLPCILVKFDFELVYFQLIQTKTIH